MRKIIFSIILFFFPFIGFSSNLYGEDTGVAKALKARKEKLLDFINGGALNANIKNLKETVNKISNDLKLDKSVKEKLLNDIKNTQKQIDILKEKLKNISEQDSRDFQQIEKKYNKELKEKQEILNEKKKLIDQLNKSIQENKINKEKIEYLLKELEKKSLQNKELKETQHLQKIYVFLFISFVFLLAYFIFNIFYKRGKILKTKLIYLRFFLLFFYVIFLIWFFFYLYPQLSVFLIFISGYLLIINSHLIASFIGSIVLLGKFKIGDVIRFQDIRGKIVNISPLHIIILPLTDEGIFKYKPMYIPNINALKENIQKDKNPEIYFHKFVIPVKADSKINIMQFVEYVENNILSKFLHIRLDSLEGNDTTYRTEFEKNGVGDIHIVFMWKSTDLNSKKIERKIIGYLDQVKKELREEE